MINKLPCTLLTTDYSRQVQNTRRACLNAPIRRAVSLWARWLSSRRKTSTRMMSCSWTHGTRYEAIVFRVSGRNTLETSESFKAECDTSPISPECLWGLFFCYWEKSEISSIPFCLFLLLISGVSLDRQRGQWGGAQRSNGHEPRVPAHPPGYQRPRHPYHLDQARIWAAHLHWVVHSLGPLQMECECFGFQTENQLVHWWVKKHMLTNISFF